LHTLAAEDVLHVPQRPRVDPYDGHVFITVRMLQLLDGRLDSEQVSLFLLPRVVISFQERPGDVWDPIRQRIRLPQGKLRERDSSFLAYALLDAVVDHCYPLLERYGEVLEDLEDDAMDASTPEILRTIQGVRRELMTIRKALWPTRELLDVLIRGDAYALPAMTVTYLRDVHAHTVQLLDAVESHRELCGTLAELYMSVVSNRMNEVMKILTIIATVFIPITFIAGVYGMNFKYLPELDYRWGYGAFWAVCAAITAALLVFFRRKGWI
ncbi:MAG: magnesium/cobalt transporter CorA, partial [Myxococcales bacterium]|nr:magnesium/cobalt transporter CorA [Myxococcales bacterium]